MKRIAIIGTTSYIDRMKIHARSLEEEGHQVSLPCLDSNPGFNELELCEANIGWIRWSDEVHVFWDQRSAGTMFDCGAAIALKKPIKIIYMEPKVFRRVLELWEKKTKEA